MSKLAVANIIFETTEANRIEYTGNNVVRVRANGGLQIPFGTTAQRVSPEYGIIRYNTDLQTVEMYDAGGWYNMPTGGYVNSIYTVANSAYAAANNVGPQIAPTFNTANAAFGQANLGYTSSNVVYAAVNSAFATINADYAFTNSAYASINSNWTVTNTVYGVANAAYGAANNVGPQIAPAYNTANAAFAAANTKFSSSGGTISGAVEITADLTVHGNTRFVDQQTLQVGDPLIYLAANNYASDVVDIGFVANYVNATSSNVHTGLFRSSGTKEYYLFQGYDKEPLNNYIDPTGNNITMAVLNSTVRTSNLILGGANTINWISSAYASINSNWTVTNTAYSVSNAAFGKANTALQNTSGTFAGDLSITGNMGIGTSTSSWSAIKAIELMGPGSAIKGALFSAGSTNGFGLVSNAYYDGTNWKSIYSSGFSSTRYELGESGQHQWFTAPSTVGGSTVTWTERMRITSTGQVLVNTSSALIGGAYIFNVLGQGASGARTAAIGGPDTATTAGGTAPILTLYNSNSTVNNLTKLGFGTSSGSEAAAIAGVNTDHTNAYGHLIFITRGSSAGYGERMRIMADGNIGINNTNPGYMLDVSGTTRLGNNGVQGNPNSTDITSTAYTLLSGTGGNYLAFGQYGSGNTYAQWIQSSYANPTTAIYNIALQPLGGNVGIGTSSPSVSLDVGSRTDGIRIPVGTTAQRPTGTTGVIRFNSSTGFPEWYDTNAVSWRKFSENSYLLEIIIVAGGGGGGYDLGGGGGAGGLIYSSSVSVTAGVPYTVTIGGGGTYSTATNVNGTNGGNSSAFDLTAIGGGGGGSYNAPTAGSSGGSGGGGGSTTGSGYVSGGSGTSGQGNAGGSGYRGVSDGSYGITGGGGGAGAAGNNGDNANGKGGNGLQYSQFSSWGSPAGWFAGGGGGSSDSSGAIGAGGSGGGGTGGQNGGSNGNGVTNTGGGAGGAGLGNAGTGGSGIVLIRYIGTQRGTGGTVSSSGGYTYHAFTTSGTFTA